MKLGSVMAAGTAALLLGACTSYTYQKPGVSAQQVEADTKDCQEYQLRRWISLGGDYVENMDRDEFEKPCMEARGYRQVTTSVR